MTHTQKAAEKIEREEQLARHIRERVDLERSLLEGSKILEASASRKRRELDTRQLKETFQLMEKYGRKLGPGGRSILDGTYKQGRR